MKYIDSRFKILTAFSLLAGLLIGWIDTSPHWDDTGITIAMIFISSFILGIFTNKNAWMFALIIGLCITSMNYLVSGRFDSAFSLVISLAGVYGGFSLKYLIRA